MANPEFDKFVNFLFGNAKLVGIELTGPGLDRKSLCGDVVLDAMLHLDWGEGGSKNLREGVEKPVVRVIDFVDE